MLLGVNIWTFWVGSGVPNFLSSIRLVILISLNIGVRLTCVKGVCHVVLGV